MLIYVYNIDKIQRAKILLWERKIIIENMWGKKLPACSCLTFSQLDTSIIIKQINIRKQLQKSINPFLFGS